MISRIGNKHAIFKIQKLNHTKYCFVDPFGRRKEVTKEEGKLYGKFG